MAAALAVAAMMMPAPNVLAQEPGIPPPPLPSSQGPEARYTIKVNSELVLVNVTVRDKSGKLVRDLKPEDFTVQEDGKRQKLESFDIQDITQYAQGGSSQVEVNGAPIELSLLTTTTKPPRMVRDRRLIVLFFDTSAMEADELERAANSARKFISTQMGPADMVAVVTFDTSLQIAQDFTTDRDKLTKALDKVQGVEGQGMANGDTGTSEGTPDTGGTYVADDTEYNTFNTDRRLQALMSLAQTMAQVEQKKSVLYFSSGLTRTGTENQAQLRATINAAVRSNMSIYPVDSRGLQGLPPGGDASTASLRGTSAYSGAAVQSQLDSNFASQETLTTMASDTGGKAFLDTNDFGKAYDRVQADTETYYLLGYRSTNLSRDGRYRHITVKVNRPGVRLEYRRGYYGPRDFRHFNKDEREQQLADEMMSDLPNTDLPVYLANEIFRVKDDRYYVPVSIVVPGSAIPFVSASEKDKATLDIAGLVREAKTKLPVGQVRETVKLNVNGTQRVRSRNVQYNTGFLLPAGSYHLKFVVREIQNGRIGSFESDMVVPDMHKLPLRMSTVVLASQKAPAKGKTLNPLVANGEELVPNVAHVFSTNTPMTFYYEVYEPAKQKSEDKNTQQQIHLLTNIQFFRGKMKAYQTPIVEARSLSAPDRKAVIFQFEVPLSELRPGWYTCQINIIDDAGGTFAFPRLPILVRAPSEPAAAAE
jgi:VWFA-related protein